MQMKIKTTIGELRNSKESLKTLSGLSGLGDGIPWKVSRMLVAVEEEMKKAQKMFEDLLHTHAIKDENCKPETVKNEDDTIGFKVKDPALYLKELEQANTMEVTIDADIATPKMFEFSDVTPQFFLDLSWWIVDPEKIKIVENKLN